MTNEKKKLDDIARSIGVYSEGADVVSMEYFFNIFRRHYTGGDILEVGAAEGVLSQKLAELLVPLTLLDGSAILCEKLRQTIPNAEVVHALVEEYEPRRQFNNIVANHLLEHVADAEGAFRRLAEWLAPGGLLFACVPNAMSLHRQAATIMGLLPHEEAMSERDREIGHERIYNPSSLARHVRAAELEILHSGGYWLKPVSNAQINESWNAEMIAAFMQLGERYPDVAADIYIIARK